MASSQHTDCITLPSNSTRGHSSPFIHLSNVNELTSSKEHLRSLCCYC